LDQGSVAFATTRLQGKVPVGRTAIFDAISMLPLGQLQAGQQVVIPLPGGGEVGGLVNLVQVAANGIVRVGGSLTGGQAGSFSLGQDSSGVAGRVLLPQEKLAYVVSTPGSGRIQMREVALSDVICYPMPLDKAEREQAPPGSGPEGAPPELRSRPGTTAVLYLDFDGATVTDPDWPAYAPDGVTITGPTITAAPSSLSNADITQVWNRVKEDFWPFNVNVTTVESDYLNAPVGRRMRVIITPTDTAEPGSGGVAYRDSFTAAGTNSFTTDVPCWVFNYSVDAVVEAISHELGHTLGLRHDGRDLPGTVNDEEYYHGHPQYGSFSWGPVMGASYNVLVTQWSKGEYDGANNTEDDFAIIAGQQPTALYGVTNNTGYVADEAGDDRPGATALDVSSYTINRTGTITTASDSDYYVFTVDSPRKLSLNVTPSNSYYKHANLDAQFELQNASGTVLTTADPDFWLSASMVTTVPAGTYYLRVRSAAHPANLSGYYPDYGYSTYGSVGPYTLTGTLENVVAPSITANPQNQNLYASNNLSLSASAIGTAPLNYQWKKDGNALANDTRISGATASSLYISNLAVADSGNYTLTASNAAGSATTTAASVVVTLPAAPTFSGNPYDTSVVEGNNLYLYAYASSPVNVTYQWYKNGILVPNQTSSSFYKNSVTTADAGSYWVVATNPGGSATSTTAVVTITAATLPNITTQPQDADLFTGQYYQIFVGANSNAPLTYQWYRNGVAIAGAIYSYYYLSPASAGNAGEYSVAVTSPAGTVTSGSATITVSSTLPPRITSQPSSQPYAIIGSSASFYVSAEGTGPLTYQWYRNGVALVNGTSSSLYLYSITAADAGEYYVTVSNPNGTVQSDTVILDLSISNPPETYWYEAKEFEGVVYFLFKNSAKIARYDLATETWLPAWNLIHAPTAFTVSTDAVYVAFGTTIKKYSRSFIGESTLATTTYSAAWLEVANGKLLAACPQGYAYTTFVTFNTTTGAQIDSDTFIYTAGQGFSYSAAAGKIYGRTTGISPAEICSVVVNPDGTIGAEDETPYHGDYPEGVRTFTLQDGTFVTDNGGIVYNATNLTFKASFGFGLKDAVTTDNGYCVLTGTRLYRFDQNFQQVGWAKIPVYGVRLARRGTTLYSFVQPTTGNSQPTVHKTDIADLVPEPPAPVVSGYARKIIPDQVVMGEDGVVYVYNKALKNIFRWSTAARHYLPSIPLVAKPRYLAYSAPNRALYFDDGSTQIKRVEVDSASLAETTFYTSPQSIRGMQTAGSRLIFGDPSGAWDTHYVVSAAGTLLDSADWNYYSREFTWSPANNRLYFFRDDSSPNDLMWETISPAGEITEHGDSPYHGEVITTLPIRVATDASTVLLGSGQLYNGTTLSLVGTLANSILDAAWSNGQWHTLRANSGGSQVQTWSSSDRSLVRSVAVAGKPLRIFALSGNRLLVITSVQGFLQYSELSVANLAVSSHVDTAETPPPVPADLNADGHPDILLQNLKTGQPRVWLMNGPTVSGNTSIGTLPAEWVVVATADFNGDGLADLLMQNSQTGARRIRFMQGISILGDTDLGILPLEWSIAAAADFNADGKPDLLWQNTVTGQRYIWFMNGATAIDAADLGIVDPTWSIAAAADFSADGKPDILWQNTVTGRRYIWFMNGATAIDAADLGVVDPAWSIAAAADYNADGKPDILWQNTQTNDVFLWFMSGATKVGGASLGTLPPGWHLVGTPAQSVVVNPHDFNADSQTDLLWQNTVTGQRYIWFMNDATAFDAADLGIVDPAWSIVTAADFSADGKPDLLWQNTVTGQRYIWFMDGATYTGAASLGIIDPAWSIVTAADFNADGKPDLLWQNTTTGQRYIWFMDGATAFDAADLGVVDPAWSIAAAADFNADGKPDLLWQNTATGERVIWFMNGTTGIGAASLGIIDPAWSIATAADFNADGKPDILWQNTVTGERYLWFMNGATYTGATSLGIVDPAWSITN